MKTKKSDLWPQKNIIHFITDVATSLWTNIKKKTTKLYSRIDEGITTSSPIHNSGGVFNSLKNEVIPYHWTIYKLLDYYSKNNPLLTRMTVL